MIQNLTFIILFLKTLVRAQKFFILVHTFYWTSSEFFLFQIFKQKASKPTKTSEKGHSFSNTASRKKPHLFYELQLTWHWKQYAPKTQPKTFLTLQVFQQTRFCIVPKQNNICTAQFLKHFESRGLYIYVYLAKKVFIPKM